MGIIKKIAIKDHLASIADQIKTEKLYAKLDKLRNFQKSKDKKMKQILDPQIDQAEFDSVSKWFGSKIQQDKESEAIQIWEDAVKTGAITARNFNKFALFCRFTCAICDKNRPGCYFFTVEQYLTKLAVWIPDGAEIWCIDQLPQGFKLYEAPNDDKNKKPSCFEIRLDGSQEGIKNQTSTTLVINQKCYDLLEKYQDLKRICHGKIDQKDKFFINFNGKPLSRLQRYKGSLLEHFGSVTGIPDFKMTSIRKASEGVIQSNSDIAMNTKELNNHQSSVVPLYDNMSSSRRAIFINAMSRRERSGECYQGPEHDEQIKNHLQKRKEIEKIEQEKLKKEATRYFEEQKARNKLNKMQHGLNDDELSFMSSQIGPDMLAGSI